MTMKKFLISTLVLLFTGWSSATADNEDGSRLWLRLETTNAAKAIKGVKGTAMTELQTYWKGGSVELKKEKGIAGDGYTIKSNGGKIVISAACDAGLLYGAYHLLRLLYALSILVECCHITEVDAFLGEIWYRTQIVQQYLFVHNQ